MAGLAEISLPELPQNTSPASDLYRRCEMTSEIIIEWWWDLEGVDKLAIRWADYEPPKLIAPTPEEYGACPDQFRCFICQEMKGKKKHFAGEIRFQRICRECWQATDDWTVRGLISFDLRHGKIVRGYPTAKHGGFYSIGKDGKHLDHSELARRWRKVNLEGKEIK